MSKSNNLMLLASIAFIAGFLAVLLFHQPMLIILKAIALAPENSTPYAMAATSLGIPRVVSLAFWGGIWGIVLAILVAWIDSGLGYWLSGLVIGALAPSLVNWFVVLPLKGEPVGGGWAVSGVVTALIVNGVWGLGTVLLCRLFGRSVFGSKRAKANVKRERREKINR